MGIFFSLDYLSNNGFNNKVRRKEKLKVLLMESQECPKCGKIIKAGNSSQMKINMALHLNKHKIDGF